jgi:hypothetical protein
LKDLAGKDGIMTEKDQDLQKYLDKNKVGQDLSGSPHNP